MPDSWLNPEETADVMAVGVVRLLEAIRAVNPAIRFCQAGSSEMFGQVDCEPQNETTPVCAPHALRHRQGVRLLGGGELPPALRPLRLHGESLTTTNRRCATSGS